MSSLTKAQCLGMTEYNGTNPEDILTLRDPRGEGQNYQVAKLADDNCWMLNNLKLGSTTSSIPLNSTDTNLPDGTTYSLPMIDNDQTDPDHDYDIPRVYSFWDDTTSPQDGSVKSDGIDRIDITKDDFYGYHYNWCAVTASDTGDPTCQDSVDDDANRDICPRGWKLPTYIGTQSFLNLDSRYNSIPANFQFTGPFKGVFAGWRDGSSWSDQGDYGYWWSSTHDSSSDVLVFSVYASGVSPGYLNRYYGLSVRCLLQ
jgi:hypothetical protein